LDEVRFLGWCEGFTTHRGLKSPQWADLAQISAFCVRGSDLNSGFMPGIIFYAHKNAEIWGCFEI